MFVVIRKPPQIGSAVFCLPCWGTSWINRTVPSGWSTRSERVGNPYGPNWCKVPQSRRRLSTQQGGSNTNGRMPFDFFGLVLSALVLVICRWLCSSVWLPFGCRINDGQSDALTIIHARQLLVISWSTRRLDSQRTFHTCNRHAETSQGNGKKTWCPFLMGTQL